MRLSQVEQVIMDRFAEKCRIAGGLRKGYMLRRGAISYGREDDSGLDFDRGLEQLLEKELLKVNEGGGLYYLTESGVSFLAG